MRAIVQSGYGGPDRLQVADVPDPVPGPRDVLLRVRAASLNGSDRENLAGTPFYARLNGLRKPRDPIPGSDVAGVVVAVGAEVTAFAPGDEVFGELRGYRRGLAELVATPSDLLLRRPAGLSAVEAAAIPQAGCIGLRAVEGIGSGDRVLVNGAGGAGGGFVVGLAKHRGTVVIAVDHGSKALFLRTLGADETVAYETEDWTAHRGRYDVIVDLVGYRSPLRVHAALSRGGAYRLIGGQTRVLLATATIGLVLRLVTGRRVGVLAVPQSRAALGQITDLVTAGAVAPWSTRSSRLTRLQPRSRAWALVRRGARWSWRSPAKAEQPVLRRVGELRSARLLRRPGSRPPKVLSRLNRETLCDEPASYQGLQRPTGGEQVMASDRYELNGVRVLGPDRDPGEQVGLKAGWSFDESDCRPIIVWSHDEQRWSVFFLDGERSGIRSMPIAARIYEIGDAVRQAKTEVLEYLLLEAHLAVGS